MRYVLASKTKKDALKQRSESFESQVGCPHSSLHHPDHLSEDGMKSRYVDALLWAFIIAGGLFWFKLHQNVCQNDPFSVDCTRVDPTYDPRR